MVDSVAYHQYDAVLKRLDLLEFICAELVDIHRAGVAGFDWTPLLAAVSTYRQSNPPYAAAHARLVDALKAAKEAQAAGGVNG